MGIVLGGSAGDSPGVGSGRGYVLRAGEGEVLRMGPPIGGHLTVTVDPAATGVPGFAMGVEVLEGEIPVHLHEHESEVLFVHAGEGMATLGDEQVPVGSGATIYVPPGTWHGVRRVGAAPAEIVWAVAAGPGESTRLEKFFRAVGAAPGVAPKTLGPEEMADVMAKHGMRPRPPADAGAGEGKKAP